MEYDKMEVKWSLLGTFEQKLCDKTRIGLRLIAKYWKYLVKKLMSGLKKCNSITKLGINVA